MRPRAVTLLVTAAVALVGCSNPYTPAGYEGYVFERPRIFGTGGFRGVVQGPGNYGVSMFRNEILNIDIRPQTYTEQFRILAKDDLNITFRFHAVISIQSGQVEEVVTHYGAEQWYDRFVKEPFRTFVRDSVQVYESREVKSKRQVIAQAVQERVTAHLEKTPFRLVSLVVGNIDYPEIVAKAVEQKLAAQQLLEEKETQKEIAKSDAEIRIEEAKGIAQAQRIINATLTANYLQHEAIQAQLEMASSPNHTTVYIPVGKNGIPLVHETGRGGG
jgi:regulator of protease activity HflC (stomatin/prohibitin superfamily)